MAESGAGTTLSEQYLLKEKEEKVDTGAPKAVVNVAPEEPLVAAKTDESAPASEESSGDPDAATGESNETAPTSGEDVTEAPPAAVEESSESAEQENSEDQEAVEQTPEIKLETAPADFRFPTTNQSRHCFTRYVEYHRCVAATGEGAPECDKFAKYYRSLCPSEWVERWNEQRANGTFPGPL